MRSVILRLPVDAIARRCVPCRIPLSLGDVRWRQILGYDRATRLGALQRVCISARIHCSPLHEIT